MSQVPLGETRFAPTDDYTKVEPTTQLVARSPQPSAGQWMADLTLVGVVMIWGATFLLVKDAVGQTAPLFFLSVRFSFAVMALLMVGLVRRKLGRFNRGEVVGGGVVGLVYWLGFALQTIGLQYTSASNAGFITGLSVALVPLFGWLVLSYRASGAALVGVGLAVVGLTLLSLQDNFAISGGDMVEMISAAAFGLQIVLVSRYAKVVDALRFALVQLLVAAVLSFVSSLLLEWPTVGWWLPGAVLAAAVFMGVVASALAQTVQATVQRLTSPVHAAIIFTLEPVFAALFAFLLAGERLSGRQIVGCAFILVGMLFAELAPYLFRLKMKDER